MRDNTISQDESQEMSDSYYQLRRNHISQNRGGRHCTRIPALQKLACSAAAFQQTKSVAYATNNLHLVAQESYNICACNATQCIPLVFSCWPL